MERLGREKASLLDLFVSCEEKEVLRIWSLTKNLLCFGLFYRTVSGKEKESFITFPPEERRVRETRPRSDRRSRNPPPADFYRRSSPETRNPAPSSAAETCQTGGSAGGCYPGCAAATVYHPQACRQAWRATPTCHHDSRTGPCPSRQTFGGSKYPGGGVI